MQAEGGASQAWVAAAGLCRAGLVQAVGNTWTTNGATVEAVKDAQGAEMLHVRWNAGEQPPVVEVTSRFFTRDRSVDLSKPGTAAPLSTEERAKYIASTDLIPTRAS